ncbi:MAG: ribosome biogenesis GTPase Der [Actinobacteria bacterium]|nr:MAG: ribosome biogenesis GTPase Der [Actinomycetota bacterium]
MTLPLVAVVGRPNVGKSTLVNRIAQQQRAIVHEEAGVTRDRNYVRADWAGRDFTLIDTGGLDFGADVPMAEAIHRQAMIAAEEADVILFVLEGPAGVMPQDEEIADVLRRSGKPILLVVNKADTPGDESYKYPFYSLGLGEPMLVSAIHGTGSGDLLDELVALLPETHLAVEEEGLLNIAIVGRPNAGKSSLLNRLIGIERSVVSDVPGTTRDSIDTLVELEGKKYRFVDTAGLRKRAKVEEAVEYYGFVRVLRALDRAHLALLVIDPTAGVGEADQKAADYAKQRNCATIVVINKRDTLSGEQLKEFVADTMDKLRFISYAPFASVSARTGQGVERLPKKIEDVAAEYSREVSTPALNSFLGELKQRGHTVSRGGKTLKLKYAAQVGTRPPSFQFFVNHPRLVDAGYRRFLENRLREAFGLQGTPILLKFRSA